MCRRIRVAAVLFVGWFAPLCGSGEAQIEFWVSQAGTDSAEGTRDQPFASLEKARDAVLQARGKGVEGPVTVWLGGGATHRTATFKLGPEDAGKPDAPVVYRSVAGERALLRGGREIPSDWCRAVEDAAVLARLVPEVRGRVLQIDLASHGVTDYGDMSILAPMLEVFCDGRRLPLAHWPNDRWATIGEVVELAEDGTRRLGDGNKQGTAFCYVDDRPARWKDAEAVELHGFWWFGWTDEHVRIKSIDTEKREMQLVSIPGGGIRKDQWYRAINLLEEIDQPGEWYLDRAKGILYILPPPEYPECPLVISELAEPLLEIGDAPYVTFRDVTFEVTRGVAVVIGGGRQSRLAGCIVRGAGSDAVVIDHGSENGLLGCDIHDTGGMAVRVTGGNRSTLEPAKNYVVNCHIHDFAQRKLVYRPAVRLYGVGHRVAHNLIHDAPHQALAFDGNDHVFEFNEIHDVVLQSADAGVVYSGCDWTFRGNVFRHNFVHHIPHGPGLGTVGVYLDDCMSSADMIGNVFFDMNTPTFIGGGRDNRIENNVFVKCDTPVYLDSRGLRWDHFRPEGPMYETLRGVPYDKPPWSTRYPALARILDEIPQAPLGNVVARNVSVMSSWRDPEKFCRDTSEKNIDRRYVEMTDNYITEEDPGFEDMEAMDFRLRSDSVVHKEIPGFEPIPFERIGLYQDEFRATRPVKRRQR